MSEREPGLAQRKRLLIARAELGRLQIRQAGHEARGLLAPFARFVPSTSIARRREAAGIRPVALVLTAAAVPLLGRARVGRLLRIAGTGLAALRLLRHLRH